MTKERQAFTNNYRILQKKDDISYVIHNGNTAQASYEEDILKS